MRGARATAARGSRRTAPSVVAGGTISSRRRLVCVVLLISAITTAVNMLARPLTSPEFEIHSEVVAERSAQWWFALVGGLGAGIVYLALGSAVCLAVTERRGARAATAGAMATGLGALMFASGFFAFGAVNWYAADPGADDTAFELFRDDPSRVFAVQAAGFGLLVLGTLVLVVALWRSGAAPRSVAAAVAATLLLTITLGDDGRLHDVLYGGHMASLALLAVVLGRDGRPAHG